MRCALGRENTRHPVMASLEKTARRKQKGADGHEEKSLENYWIRLKMKVFRHVGTETSRLCHYQVDRKEKKKTDDLQKVPPTLYHQRLIDQRRNPSSRNNNPLSIRFLSSHASSTKGRSLPTHNANSRINIYQLPYPFYLMSFLSVSLRPCL